MVSAALSAGAAEANDGPIGFYAPSWAEHMRWERLFLSAPTPQSARKTLRALTEEPHVAGTEAGRRVAEQIRAAMAEAGFEAELFEIPVLLNYPKHVGAWLTQPEAEELSLREAGHVADKDSMSQEVFPGFHGYGAEGVAEGQVVYANYGTHDDFLKLKELGISLQGKVVLARYGRNFRGLKVKEAQEAGAAGILIYSDPADDGYTQGDVYPDGPFRPESALQRGSVQFISVATGDPSTPGWASSESSERVEWSQAIAARIPSLPLSYGDAQRILSRLSGDNVPDGWQGGLPLAYHLGPGPVEVRIEVEMDYAVRPIWNVIGRLEGAVEPDQWILLGNHHDAWTYGAVDPNSGTTSLLEMVRGLAEARRAGWRPRRSLVVASWDAEEYGLVGSTEWGEALAAELDEKLVAYVNLDSSVSGPDLGVDGVGSLRDFVAWCAAGVPEPRRGGSLLKTWSGRLQVEWAESSPICLDHPQESFELRLDPLGSGSDYTVFLDHLGVPSVSFGFGGRYGVYHSIYDDFYWMERFGDPEFLYHTAAAQLYGLMALRAASADILPLRFAPYAAQILKFIDELEREALRSRRQAAAAEKAPERAPLEVDWTPVRAAQQRLSRAAQALDQRLVELQQAPEPLAADRLQALNRALGRIERAFLLPQGLPGRPWFRHAVYAPGFTTGYAPWPLPGLTQALKEKDAQLWEQQAAALIERFDAAVSALEQARASTD